MQAVRKPLVFRWLPGSTWWLLGVVIVVMSSGLAIGWYCLMRDGQSATWHVTIRDQLQFLPAHWQYQRHTPTEPGECGVISSPATSVVIRYAKGRYAPDPRTTKTRLFGRGAALVSFVEGYRLLAFNTGSYDGQEYTFLATKVPGEPGTSSYTFEVGFPAGRECFFADVQDENQCCLILELIVKYRHQLLGRQPTAVTTQAPACVRRSSSE